MGTHALKAVQCTHLFPKTGGGGEVGCSGEESIDKSETGWEATDGWVDGCWDTVIECVISQVLVHCLGRPSIGLMPVAVHVQLWRHCWKDLWATLRTLRLLWAHCWCYQRQSRGQEALFCKGSCQKWLHQFTSITVKCWLQVTVPFFVPHVALPSTASW